MNLYEIANNYQAILNESIDQETGEMLPQALSKLDEIAKTMEDKAIAIASYVKNLDAECKAIEEAKKHMAEREARLERRAAWLTNYLQNNMERCGISEVKCPQFVIKLKKCPVSTDILNEEIVPDEYKNVKQVVTVDKVKVKNDLLSGTDVPGAILKQKNRLEIR